MMDVSAGALRGLGSSLTPMLISVLGVCGLRMLWIATIFQIPRFHTLQHLFLSYPITWVVTHLCQLAAFLLIFRKYQQQTYAPAAVQETDTE